MSGPLGTGSGGGAGKDVLAGTGISVSGTTAFTVDNTGVLSLAGSGVSVSSSTGNVTVTGPTISGGTGISVAGGGTTSLTVSATGVNTVSAGTGISVSGTTSLTVSNTGVTSLAGSGVSVSGATGAVTVTAPTVTGGTGISVSGSGTTSLTVSATGVQSLTAGTGISVSGTTTPTITNSGVTSIVAGTNVTVSGATGAVTINAPGFATPGSSAIGDTAAAGTATTVSRSDHVHGREAAGTPGASAVGDTASAGVATTVARSDHRHSREAFGTPVNIDASLTSLSAGSLTTVARADHVHTVSKVPVLIASQTLTIATAQVSFLSIPQTFSELNLRIWGRSAASYALDFVAVRFNNDTGANYYWSDRTGQTTGIIGAVHGSSNGSSIWNAYVDAIITQYCITTSYGKSFGGTSYINNSTTATPAAGLYQPYGLWTGTAAITRIDLLTSNGVAYSIGSKFELYGIP